MGATSCFANTRKGLRCSRLPADNAWGFCPQHFGTELERRRAQRQRGEAITPWWSDAAYVASLKRPSAIASMMAATKL
jgi:hypothetical protein